jgi:hypothetical protein
MNDRWITPEDYDTLYFSLKSDQYHKNTLPEFFYQPGTFCKVYEEDTPIMFVRGMKSLRLDIQFVNNTDFERNRRAMKENFPTFVENCKKAGFQELVFNTSSPLLKRFCKKLGFREVEGDELRYQIG